jgi:hypothetical protein
MAFQVWRTCLNVANLFLNAEKFNRWLGRYPINSLFRQLYKVKADAAGFVAVLLHGQVKPILLLYSVALPVVISLR